MTRFVIVPYKSRSRSARALSRKLPGIVVLRRDYLPNIDDVIINWGCGSLPEMQLQYLEYNHPIAVRKASNKLLCFRTLEDANFAAIPEFTTDIEEARTWFYTTPIVRRVVCRTVLNGTRGEGIVLADTQEALVPAPLFTAYVNKVHEYRIHVMDGFVIDVQEKRKRRDVEFVGSAKYIRNHHNGWVFCHSDVHIDERAKELAIQAVSILGLDFGAVDIGVGTEDTPTFNRYCVYEINTAPGLEGQTIGKYAEAFKVGYIS